MAACPAYIARMDASAPARDSETSVRTRRSWSMSGDLRLALLVLGLCLFDALYSLIPETTVAAKVDWLQRFLELLQASLLCIVPGAVAARLVFSRYPATHRECLGIIAVFLVGSAIGHVPALWLTPAHPVYHFQNLWPLFAQSWLSYAIASTAVVYAMYSWRRDVAARQELHRTQVALLALKTDRAEAELLRLRAQIEPHFLFNTLATIMQLYESDAAAASRTLALLIDYMDTSHTHMRQQETALRQELALAEGYLAIQRLRMGERLRYAIDVPPAVGENRVPPASLLTLIENAIKHGLAPVAGGGTLRVTARRDDTWLVLTVSDDGAGFRATSGRGLGLANLRARLQGLYGEGASLRLTSADGGGVAATMRLPLGTAVEALSP
ncbi:MAG TPA: histidine kinase [Burkholderiaceae bacterium]|nr:histidine kinase [Burkholderiaceae bacterium]